MLNSRKIIERVATELIYGGHIVSLISPALILSICILQDMPIHLTTLIIAYIIPLIVYSYNYQNESENITKISSAKSDFISRHKKLFPILISIDIFILLALSIISFNYGFFIFTLIIITGGILYTIIFKVLTRYIFCFKNIYVTAIWAYAGTFFLLFYYSLDFSIFYIFIFIYFYIKILINNIFFDIKDINSDGNKNLITVPIKLGKNNTIYLLHILNMTSAILLVALVYYNLFPFYSLSLLLMAVYVFIYLEKGRTADYNTLLNYTYMMADAEFIFWPIVLFMSKFFFNN